MLSSISWQHYLAAIVILTATYYLYIGLHYYRIEIRNLFSRNQTLSGVLSGVPSSTISVMGEAKLEYGASHGQEQELQFTDIAPDDPEVHSSVAATDVDENQSANEPTRELVQEASKLIEAFKDINDKSEFLSLLKILIESYKSVQEDIDLPLALSQVVEITNEKLLFPVALTELQGFSA